MSIITFKNSEGVALLQENGTVKVWDKYDDFIDTIIGQQVDQSRVVCTCAVSINTATFGCLILTEDNSIIVSTRKRQYCIKIPDEYEQIISYVETNNKIIVFTLNKIYCYSYENREITLFDQQDVSGNIVKIRNNRQGRFILGSVFITDLDIFYSLSINDKGISIRKLENKSCRLIHSNISDIVIAYYNNIYILTRDGVLYYYNTRYEKIKKFNDFCELHPYDLFSYGKDDKNNKNIKKILFHKNTLFIITSNNECIKMKKPENTSQKIFLYMTSVTDLWTGIVNVFERTDGNIMTMGDRKFIDCPFQEKLYQTFEIYRHYLMITESGEVYHTHDSDDIKKLEYFDDNKPMIHIHKKPMKSSRTSSKNM